MAKSTRDRHQRGEDEIREPGEVSPELSPDEEEPLRFEEADGHAESTYVKAMERILQPQDDEEVEGPDSPDPEVPERIWEMDMVDAHGPEADGNISLEGAEGQQMPRAWRSGRDSER